MNKTSAILQSATLVLGRLNANYRTTPSHTFWLKLYMKQLLIIFILFFPLFGITQKQIIFSRKTTKIDKLLVLPPITVISVIYKGDIKRIDSVLTAETFRLTSTQLQKSFPDSVSTNFFSGDSAVRSMIANFVIQLNRKIKNEGQIKKYILPDSIVHLFGTSTVDYVFCTYNIGFKRTRDNLVNTHQEMEITDIFFGHGLRPLESNLLLTCFVMDLKQKNILFFERDVRQNSDPTDIKVIKLMLTRIITHCLL